MYMTGIGEDSDKMRMTWPNPIGHCSLDDFSDVATADEQRLPSPDFVVHKNTKDHMGNLRIAGMSPEDAPLIIDCNKTVTDIRGKKECLPTMMEPSIIHFGSRTGNGS